MSSTENEQSANTQGSSIAENQAESKEPTNVLALPQEDRKEPSAGGEGDPGKGSDTEKGVNDAEQAPAPKDPSLALPDVMPQDGEHVELPTDPYQPPEVGYDPRRTHAAARAVIEERPITGAVHGVAHNPQSGPDFVVMPANIPNPGGALPEHVEESLHFSFPKK